MRRVNIYLLISFVLMYVTQFGVLVLLRLTGFTEAHPVVQALYILGGSSPTLAALYVVFKLYGKEEKDSYFANLFRFKVPVFWWCYALFIPFLLLLFINLLQYRSLAHLTFETGTLIMLPLFLLTSIFMGGLEELGWRGVFFDELRRKMSVVKLTLITGVLWAFWHLPLFFIDEILHSDLNFFPYLISTVMFSGYFSYLILKTRSIGLAVIMHAAINAASNIGIRISTEHTFSNYFSLAILTLLSFYLIHRFELKEKEATAQHLK